MNLTEFYKAIEMAGIYAEDGAWATAAERLREAAAFAGDEAKRRADAIARYKGKK
jgi:hypothetical protein